MIRTRFDTYEILSILNGGNAKGDFGSGIGYNDFVWKEYEYVRHGSRRMDCFFNKYNNEPYYETRNCGGNYSRLNAIDAKLCGIRHHEYSDPSIVLADFLGSRYF